MKIKHDFVTNSSSSSFIVALPNVEIDFNFIKQKVMFIEKAEVVYNDIKKQEGVLLDNSKKCLRIITEKVNSGYFSGHLDHHKFCDQECRKYGYDDYYDLYDAKYKGNVEIKELREKIYKKYEKENKKVAKKIAEKFIQENLGKVAYFFVYGDEGGRFWSEMEHGDTFIEFPHLTISGH